MIAELTALDWTLLALAAVLVGIAKTAIGGVGALAVVLFAAVLPARESTGALLPLLIAGDVVAVAVYRRHGSTATLVRLLPGVVPGLVLGALFIARVDDTVMRISIGTILVALGAVQVVQRVRRPAAEALRLTPARRHVWAVGAGLLAGFATMTANAAGSVMTLYLILAGLPKLQLLGTTAWFFLCVNLLKVPFSTSLDLIDPETLLVDLWLVPAMLVGAYLGVHAVRRMNQEQFELIALVLSTVAAGLLVVTA